MNGAANKCRDASRNQLLIIIWLFLAKNLKILILPNFENPRHDKTTLLGVTSKSESYLLSIIREVYFSKMMSRKQWLKKAIVLYYSIYAIRL